MQLKVRVQSEDFCYNTQYQALRQSAPNKTGAICCFSGLVREYGDNTDVIGLELEHYPGMTEKLLSDIAQRAAQRWSIQACTIIHRVGRLLLNEQIVYVGVASAHRSDAFAACEYIMDYLKTEAPFWKKELSARSEAWVSAKESDKDRAKKWQ